MYQYRAHVIRVIDGDTLHLNLDLGLDVSMRMTVRLVGVNTPELPTDAGKAAAAFVGQWLTAHADPAGRVTVATVKDKREKFGRYLADVIGGDNSSLCRDLLKSGHAVPYP